MAIRDLERARVVPVAEPDLWRIAGYVRIGVIALLAVGLLLRIWALFSPIGTFDSDSAVPGLMARHILTGELPTFYWGQPYGGSIESFAAAALFLVMPPWVVVVKLVPMLFCAAATAMTFLVGRRLVGEQAAALGAAFFWATPFTIWYSTKTGPYWASLVLTLLCVLLLLRVAEADRPRRWEAGGLGVCLGLAWWANPSVLLILPIAALVLSRRLARHWRLSWAVATGFVVGAAPWIVFNLRYDLLSLDIAAGQPGSSYVERLQGFFTTALPMALGLRRVFSHQWLLAPAGQLLYVAALGAFAVFAVRSARDHRLRLLCAFAVVYPFLYALSPFTWYLAQPRYLLFLLPFLALLAGKAADGRRRAWVGLGASAAVALVGIALFPTVQPFAGGAELPVGTGEAHHLLEEHGITRAYADYWIAYRLTFESRERTIVAPLNAWRYQPYQDEVAGARRPAYVFLADSPLYRQFLDAAGARWVPVTVYHEGRWAVVIPEIKVLPADWPEAFGCPETCKPAWAAWK